ncbi:hypothetical protein Dimus_006079, partial [Dionaea muscipula]
DRCGDGIRDGSSSEETSDESCDSSEAEVATSWDTEALVATHSPGVDSSRTSERMCDGSVLLLEDFHHVPDLKKSLLSLGALEDK